MKFMFPVLKKSSNKLIENSHIFCYRLQSGQFFELNSTFMSLDIVIIMYFLILIKNHEIENELVSGEGFGCPSPIR